MRINKSTEPKSNSRAKTRASSSSRSRTSSAPSTPTSSRKRAKSPTPAAFLFSAPTLMPQGDGTFLLKPGKPRTELTPAQAARELSTHRSSIYAFVDAGLLVKVRRPSPHRLLLDAEEVAEFRTATQDAEYWTPGKRKALAAAKGRSLYQPPGSDS